MIRNEEILYTTHARSDDEIFSEAVSKNDRDDNTKWITLDKIAL